MCYNAERGRYVSNINAYYQQISVWFTPDPDFDYNPDRW